MHLDQFLTESGTGSAAFADLIGVSFQHIYKLRERKATPSAALMQRIHQATGGRVDPNSWLVNVGHESALRPSNDKSPVTKSREKLTTRVRNAADAGAVS